MTALKYVSSMYTEKCSRKIFIAFVRNNRHHHEQKQGNVWKNLYKILNYQKALNQIKIYKKVVIKTCLVKYLIEKAASKEQHIQIKEG